MYFNKEMSLKIYRYFHNQELSTYFFQVEITQHDNQQLFKHPLLLINFLFPAKSVWVEGIKILL